MIVTGFFLRNDTFLDYGYIVAFSLFIADTMRGMDEVVRR